MEYITSLKKFLKISQIVHIYKKDFHDDKNRARNMHFRDQLFNMLRNGFFKKFKIP